MNVFVLCTGRCGSVSFIKACTHITNYSAGHESRVRCVGSQHFAYQPNHIEADNRLSWFLGTLDRVFGDDAFYVHLRRNDKDTARSFLNRWHFGIIAAFRSTIMIAPPEADPMVVCLDYVQTVNSNIQAFLKDKSQKMEMSLESMATDFPKFWSQIGAQGDLSAALSEWNHLYNKFEPLTQHKPVARNPLKKIVRIVRRLPEFVRQA